MDSWLSIARQELRRQGLGPEAVEARLDQICPVIRRMGCGRLVVPETPRNAQFEYSRSLVYKTRTTTSDDLERLARVKRARLFLWQRTLARARRVLARGV
jgi:hypothetical protein